jgi:hypothetical protein
VGPRSVLDAVVKRKIASPRRESNPRTPIVLPVAQRIPTELSRLSLVRDCPILFCYRYRECKVIMTVKIQVEFIWVVRPCGVVVG